MPAGVETLMWVAAVVTALWVIWTRGIVPMVKTIAAIAHTWEEVQSLAPIIRTMAKEFQPNDGESLRDKVDYLNLAVIENQTTLEHQVAAHDTYHEGLEARILGLEAE